MLEPGTLIDNRFQVEALVGEGGLAAVYRVRHAALGSVHALKLLTWRKRSLAERLILEGRIQAQLQHPNIVAVTDLVRHDGQFGLLMEYVDHLSLEDYLGEHGGFGLDDGLAMFAPILSGCSAAHEAGVTHRDLKPANILLANGPRGLVPKVTDFGIAKVVAEVAEGSTAVGATMGTPGYLAPEQMTDSSTIDHRADIFALGAIAFELITGLRAFADENGNLSVMSTTNREPSPLVDVVPEAPVFVCEALRKAMSKDPADRFQSCGDFAEAVFRDNDLLLASFQSMAGVTAPLSLGGIRRALEDSIERSDQVAPTLAPPEPTTTVSSDGPAVAPMPWMVKYGLAGFAVFGCLAAIGVGVGSALLMGADTPQDPTTPTETPTVPVSAPVVQPAIPAPVAEPVADPVPVAEPEPVVAPEPAVAKPEPAPNPVPDVAPEPAAVPEPIEQPEPAPEPVAEPEPVPEPVAEPVPAPVVAPVPVPVVVAAPVPEPAAPSFPDVGGRWSGKASNRAFQVTFADNTSSSLSGSIVFLGPTPRDEPLSGSIDEGGRVRFSAGGFRFTGQVSGNRLSGSYQKGSGRSLSWSVSR